MVTKSQHVVVGSCNLVNCLLTVKLCGFGPKEAHLFDELHQALPDGYRQWAIEHLASVMPEGPDASEDETPSRVVVAWGRIWERGSMNSMFTKIACFTLQERPSGVFESRCQPCFVACTPEGAVARYQFPAVSTCEIRHSYEPRASRLATAACRAVQSVWAHLCQWEYRDSETVEKQLSLDRNPCSQHS